MGRVVHFELFGDEPGKLADFYRTVFGWQIESWNGPFEYYLTSTGPRDAAGIDGAIAPFGSAGDQRTVVTVDVDDIDAALGRAVAAGARVVTEKQEIPGVGQQAYLTDPSGTVFGVLEAVQAAPSQAPSGDAWAEVGERLREFGTTLGAVVSDTVSSPQAQRLREQAEKAAASIGEASRTAADKARPHVVSALERVGQELGELAERLSKAPEPAATPTVPTGDAVTMPHSADRLATFVDGLFKTEGERLTRDEVIARASEAGMPHDAAKMFSGLPDGQFSKSELLEVLQSSMGPGGQDA
jgi:predicted enzyme related to lactoylglutathione lyase